MDNQGQEQTCKSCCHSKGCQQLYNIINRKKCIFEPSKYKRFEREGKK